MWSIVSRCDKYARRLANRHYNRQNPWSKHFVPPGRCLVLLSQCRNAVWVTSWPYPEYAFHGYGDAWINSLFRNESDKLSSSLIADAIEMTLQHWPNVPESGLITYVDATRVRHKRDPGRCYRKAGFRHIGTTKRGLYVLQLDNASIRQTAEQDHRTDADDMLCA